MEIQNLNKAFRHINFFYKPCHNTKKTLQIVTGNHNSFWPITVIPNYGIIFIMDQ